MADTKKLGAELGEELARERTLGSAQDREARKLIDPIVARDPKVKLPRLLANERVQAWQKATGVTDGQLKQALTSARAELKANPAQEPIRIPTRTRVRSGINRTDGGPPSGTQATDKAEGRRGVIPNRDLTLL